MEATPDLPTAATNRERNKASFIVNLLNRATHNNFAFRTGSDLLPGKRAASWEPRDMTMCGHAALLRIRLAEIVAESGSNAIAKQRCDEGCVNVAAKNGDLDVIQELRAYDIHCTEEGADLAAMNGHLEVVRDLRAHGIHCTTYGANGAAAFDRLEVVEDLRAHGIVARWAR